MSRVTIIALLFPPIQQIGARRPLRLANHLARQGHDVTVYAVHPRTPGLWNYAKVDSTLVALIDKRVRVIRTPSIHGWKLLLALRDRIRKWRRRERPNAATEPIEIPTCASQSSRSGIKQVVSKLMNCLDVPDEFSGWICTTLPVLACRSLFRRPHAIYVTGPPWSPLALAAILGRVFRVAVVVDFRDPWTLNRYVEAPHRSIAIERWVVRNSRFLIANTRTMANEFRSAYPDLSDRIHAIYNGYDDQTRCRIEEVKARTPPSRSGPFVVTHVGTLYPQRMPLRLARQLAGVAASWQATRPIRFRFVGPVWDPAPLVQEFRAADVSSSLEFVGEVPSGRALIESVNADVLLLLQQGTPQQLPAKIFEYAFTGNHLLCAADPESETADLVARYRLGELIDESWTIERLSCHLARLCDGLTGAGPVDGAFLSDFDGERLAERMAEIVLR